MIFTKEQIQEILNIMDKNSLIYSVGVYGEDVLSDTDQKFLEGMGVNVEDYATDYPSYLQSYYFGQLTGILKDKQIQTLDYEDVISYLKNGQYQPMTRIEKNAYEIARNRSYTHLKRLNTKIKSDVESSIYEVDFSNRKNYEKLINKEISEGVYKRKSVTQIVSEIGHKTGDWERDLGRIVETEMNSIFQQGRADEFRRRDEGKDPRVYKQVYPGACRHCIQAYTTKGIGSKPRIFKLSLLEANGTNIGLKVADWKPVLGSMHPWCRCHLYQIQEGEEWDEENGEFEFVKDKEELRVKSKVKITVGNKKFEV
jgi:hypothetical protein